jgi:hypothetical protein
MQITNEKPQIDDVIEAHIRANGQKIEQKERLNNAFEIYSCFREFKTANSETQNPEMKYLVPFNNLKQKLTETGLQMITGWTAESCFCPLVREDWN